jgi:hypothetical protein
VRYRSCEDLPVVLALDEIDTIPWAELQHAYGDAADIPDHLRAYAGSPPISERAAGALYGNVFHQGTRYTASPFTIPFFIGLLSRPDLRLDIVERLQAMAYGYEEGLFPNGYDTAAAEDDQRAIDNSPNQYGVDAAHTHHAVSRAWSHLVPLLDDPSRQVRSETAHLLAYLPEHAEGSVRELRSRLPLLGTDSSPSALLALGVLGHQRAGQVDLTEVTMNDATLEVRLASLCARCLLGDGLAIEPLIDALGDELPPIGSWLDGSTLTLITASIAIHGHWLTLPRAEAVGERLRSAPIFQAPWVAGFLLDQVVPSNALPENDQQLSELQRRTLELLLAAQAWDFKGAINVNWSNCLNGFLVPSDRDRLAHYLAGSPLAESVAPHLRDHLARVRERSAPTTHDRRRTGLGG